MRTASSHVQLARRIGAPLLNHGAGHLDQNGAGGMLAPDQGGELIWPKPCRLVAFGEQFFFAELGFVEQFIDIRMHAVN